MLSLFREAGGDARREAALHSAKGERVAGRTERHHSDDRVRHQHDEVTHSPLDKTPLVSIEGLPAH
eukprot:CAMPEP_0119359214 /NCGR_PEP_ID=MMETSP1334-20130426/7160_1 /TAXON_ID=127549 /ORGANISM="Calcidiscus leptoporus, Strain RCC1130" /LENGTH=65 /DNA_ID=CAMNT_0007373845 /DNA_START=195 /DNA_END=392 /DNA_ORIENTATION=-